MNVRLLTQRNLCKVQDVIHGFHSVCACSLNGNEFKWSHSQLCSTAQVTCTCETAIWENQNLTETAWKVWPRVRRALSAFSCPSTPSCHHQVSLSFYSVQALLEQVCYWLLLNSWNYCTIDLSSVHSLLLCSRFGRWWCLSVPEVQKYLFPRKENIEGLESHMGRTTCLWLSGKHLMLRCSWCVLYPRHAQCVSSLETAEYFSMSCTSDLSGFQT